MADVFISYKSEERPAAARIAELLRLNELTVWWDDHLHGEIADQEIICQIAAAHAVVVLISRRALDSNWVQGEIVRAGDRIVPVRTDDVAHDRLPTQILTRDIIDLSNWNGRPDHREFPKLVARCIQLKTGGRPTMLASPSRSDRTFPPGEAATTSIEIGQISGGTIVGGIGSTIRNVTFNEPSGKRRRDDKR
jgi:hypothetical protein